jgi:hypothetical protein
MRIFFLLFLCFIQSLTAQTPIKFDDYFIDQTLRIDYFHTGDANSEFFALDKIYKQGIWAGNPNGCIQPFELGIYLVKVIDTTSNTIIYTKGYNSIFAEYQTIGEALEGIKRTFHETVLIPCPKIPVKLVIEKRAKNNVPSPVYSFIIDPADYHINKEKTQSHNDEVIPVLKSGPSHNHVDLVILGDGYTLKEKEQFKKDLTYFTGILFQYEPYKSHKSSFNINGVFSPSEESGTDEPRQGVYKNTRFNTTFNYFNTDRYCLTDDNKSVHDVASAVPYDAVLIMVNRDRYGGGGIYNWYTIYNTGSAKRDYVFIHEFGHGFAGLADEYYNSSVAYQDIFVPGVEPLEPNITSLTDTANIKWKKYLSPELKIPTEWGKEYFDSLTEALNNIREKKINTLTELRKSGISKNEYEASEKAFDKQMEELSAKVDKFLFNHPLKGKIGVFEGANYLSKGFYRPTINSMMHKFDPGNPTFGVVNEQAIIRVIEYYTK